MNKKKSSLNVDEKEKRSEKRKKNNEIISNFMKLKCDLCGAESETFTLLRIHFKMKHNKHGYVKCCGRLIFNIIHILEHIEWHQNPDRFMCKYCNEKFQFTAFLDMHLVKHGENLERYCKPCRRLYHSTESYEKHLLKDVCRKPAQCTLCNKSYSDAVTLDKHIKSVHENLHLHMCEVCGQKFKELKSLKYHKLTVHQGIKEEPQQCKVCKNWLKSKKSLSNHMKRHDLKESSCPHCERKFPTIEHMKRHVYYNHTHPKNVPCPHCEKKYRNEKELQDHMSVHGGMKTYLCDLCDKSFSTNAYRTQHLKKVHYEEWVKKQLKRSNNPDDEKLLKNPEIDESIFVKAPIPKPERVPCEYCEKTFVNVYAMRNHVLKVHNNISPHVCDICGEKFKGWIRLKRHKLTVHEGVKEEPVQCELCKSWLANEYSLLSHMHRHKIKETECPDCELKFPTPGQMQRHAYKMHKHPKEIPCPQCDRKFRFEKELKDHSSVHTGIKLYSCELCSKSFSSKVNLTAHVKRSHHEEWQTLKLDRSYDPNVKKNRGCDGSQ